MGDTCDGGRRRRWRGRRWRGILRWEEALCVAGPGGLGGGYPHRDRPTDRVDPHHLERGIGQEEEKLNYNK